MQEKNPLISVIIPVYNSERYLRRCVDSVIGQTYEYLEIILVDDGSSDSSPGICDAYAEMDPRVKVIHQENRGLSGARNTGMDNASADLYVFVDSDDEIMPVMIEELWYIMRSADADIAECGFIEVKDPSRPPAVKIRREFDAAACRYEVFMGYDALRQVTDRSAVIAVQWNKLYRKKIFRDLRYPEGRYHEDEFVVHREIAAADSFAVTDDRLYIYYRNPGSITLNMSAEKRYHTCEAFLDRTAFFEDMGYTDLAAKSYIIFAYYVTDTLRYIDGYHDGDLWAGSIRELGLRGAERYGYLKGRVSFISGLLQRWQMIRIRLWILKNRIKGNHRKD